MTREEQYPAAFLDDLKIVLGIEGGKVDDKDDLGGRTNHGITQITYDDWRQRQGLPIRDVYEIEPQEVDAIYFEIWCGATCDEWQMPLRRIMFDTATNWNPKKAITFLQEAVRVTADGIMGPATRAAASQMTPAAIGKEICTIRMEYRFKRVRQNASQAKFLHGWIRRDWNMLLSCFPSS